MALTLIFTLIFGLFSTICLSQVLTQNSLLDFLQKIQGVAPPTTSQAPMAPLDPGAMARFQTKQPSNQNQLPTLTIASSNVPVITKGNIIIADPTSGGGGDNGGGNGGNNGGGGGNGGNNGGGTGNGGSNGGGGGNGGWGNGGGSNNGGGGSNGESGNNGGGGNGGWGNSGNGGGTWPPLTNNPNLSIFNTMARRTVLRRLQCKTVSQIYGFGQFLSPCYNSCPMSFSCIPIQPRRRRSIGYCCPFPVTEEWVNLQAMFSQYGEFSEMMS